MRFGCCLNMIARELDGTGIEWIESLAEIGYDYVELPLAEITALSDAEFQMLVKRVEQSGVKCETCNNFFPKTMRLTGSNVEIEKVMSYANKALERAEVLGANYVVFGSGPAKNVPDGYSKTKGYYQVVDLLKRVSQVVETKGITIVIEPLRKAECNLINSYQEGCQLAKDVAKDQVKVLVDFYHLSEENEPVQHIIDGAEFLKHVHFARPKGRTYPENIKETNYAPFIHALKQIHYEGRISCEAYTSDFSIDGPKTLKFFQDNF